MRITIAGAGSVGFHLAELLSKEDQDITLIDCDGVVLDQARKNLDVMTVQGDICDMKILEQIDVGTVDLFIAVTSFEQSNLLAAILAKRLGAKKTIARISNVEHLEDRSKANYTELGVDLLISPQSLAANEIQRLLSGASFTDLFEFENGKISVVGLTLDSSFPFTDKPISDVRAQPKDFPFRVIALLRKDKTVIPNKDTILQKGDHIYIASHKNSLDAVMRFMGKQLKPIKHVMIIGGTSLALRTAQRIEHTHKVTVVIEEEEIAKTFVEQLDNSLVINADANDTDTLNSEGLEHMDAFIALTANSETNIISSLMAEDTGVKKTIALVENVNYIHISQNIGVDTIINKKLIAANNIFRFVRKGKVEAIASLHGVDAEIIEFVVHDKPILLERPINQLGLPDQSIIAGVVRGEKSFVPAGGFRFKLDDKVIILALPGAISKVEQIFE